VSKCRIKPLKETKFHERVKGRQNESNKGGTWYSLWDCLLEVSHEVCGRKKCPLCHKGSLVVK